MAGLRRAGVSGRIAVVAVPAVGCLAVLGLWLYAEGGHPGSGLGGAPLAYSLGRLAGLLAGYSMMLQLLLASKLPLFKRRIGLGNMIRWHRSNGVVLLTLVALHVVLLVTSTQHLVPVSSLWQAFTWLVSTPGVPLAVAAGCVFVITGTTTVPLIRRRLGYQTWHAVHLLGYVAVGLAIPHQVQSGSTLAAVPGARVVWLAAFIAAGGVLVESRWARPFLAARHARRPVGPFDRSRRDALRLLSGAGLGAGLTLVVTRGWSAQAAGGTPGAAPASATCPAPSPSPTEATRLAVGTVTDVPDGGALDVSAVAGEPAYLVRTHNDVRLLSAVCTHAECVTAWAPDDVQFQCPCHLGTYDQQGQVVSGPPPSPLAELPIVVESGTVYLTG